MDSGRLYQSRHARLGALADVALVASLPVNVAAPEPQAFVATIVRPEHSPRARPRSTHVLHAQSPAWKSPGGPRKSSEAASLGAPAPPAPSGRGVWHRLHLSRRAKLILEHLSSISIDSVQYQLIAPADRQTETTATSTSATYPGFGHGQSPSDAWKPPRPPRPPSLPAISAVRIVWFGGARSQAQI